ncbi:MAG: hypothetical protein AAF725_19755 [Acidobacteriota bacterium]
MIKVTAPGKIILMGEHAAVYGEPALVAAIDRRAAVAVREWREPGETRGLRLSLPDLGIEQEMSWRSVLAYALRARDAWRAWREDRSRPFSRVLGESPAHLALAAIGETVAAAGDSPEDIPDAHLTVSSEIPIGSGFGSSAAVSAALVAAVAELLGGRLTTSDCRHIALEAERRQHGTPSGVDGAAAFGGGVLWAEPGEEGLSIAPVPASHAILSRIRVAHSGKPGESTGEVVAAVRRLREEDPEGFERGLRKASGATRAFRAALLSRTSRDEHEDVLRAWRAFASWLESIGVVPEPARGYIHAIEEAGGAAKISGAGGLLGPGAGSFLVYHPDPLRAENWIEKLKGLEPLELRRLGGPGLQREDRDSEPRGHRSP